MQFLLFKFFIQTGGGTALDRLAEWGPLGLLLWLVGEKAIPAIVKIARPAQERKIREVELQQQRLAELEARQVAAWSQVAEANHSLSKSLTMLSSAISTLDQRTGDMFVSITTLLERTAACEARNTKPLPPRRKDDGDAG